jgi:hypothetical protein
VAHKNYFQNFGPQYNFPNYVTSVCSADPVFRFPVFTGHLTKIIGLSPDKQRKLPVNDQKSKNGSAMTRSLKSYIMAQNFRKILCTSTELSFRCDPSKNSRLGVFLTICSTIFIIDIPVYIYN